MDKEQGQSVSNLKDTAALIVNRKIDRFTADKTKRFITLWQSFFRVARYPEGDENALLSEKASLSLVEFFPTDETLPGIMHSTNIKASDLESIKPNTKAWNDVVQNIKSPGRKKNYRVDRKEDAKQLLDEGRPGLSEKPTYTDEVYKEGYEWHPNEKNTQHAPHNNLPHIKWKDWRHGKNQGASGHIFYPDK